MVPSTRCRCRCARRTAVPCQRRSRGRAWTAILPEKRGSPEAPLACCSGRRRLPGPSPGNRSPMSRSALRSSGPLIRKIRAWSLGGSCRSMSTVPTRWRSRTSSSTTSGTAAPPTATHATGTSGWPASGHAWPGRRVTPFVQFLAGAGVLRVHEELPPDVPSYVPRIDVEKGFVMQPGGGVDIPLAERVALRLKADFMNLGNLRLAAGVAFGVGDRSAR